MKLNKKIVLPFALITIVLCVLSFYGGTQYSANQKASGLAQFAGGQPFGGAATDAPRTGAMRGGGSGMVSGEILSVDATSITIKDRTGGSRIVFLGTSSEVMKSVTGTIADLTVGTNVITNGTPNADGSITATTVQIRPAGQGFDTAKGQ
jgi:hypothetical protein